MEFRDVVRRRRMVRNYDPDRPVPPEVVERLLAHAVRAPSAGFSQGWGFLVLEREADRERFWAVTSPRGRLNPELGAERPARIEPASGAEASGASRPAGPEGQGMTGWLAGMRRAPLLVVAHSNRAAYLDRYAEPDKGWTDRDPGRWPAPYWDIDAGFASLLILLTAVDEGLGACFFGIPPERVAGYREAFGVPPDFSPIGAITVGYPAPDRRSPSLKRGLRPPDQVIHRGHWSGERAI